MGCDPRRLHALVDGELTGREETALREHVASCASCRDALASVERADQALRAGKAPLPSADLTARIVHHVLSRPSRRRVPALLVGAVALIACYPLAQLVTALPLPVDLRWLGLLVDGLDGALKTAVSTIPVGDARSVLPWLGAILAAQAIASILLLRRREAA